MSLIDRAGRFRGIPSQGVMDSTKNGFPQLVVRLDATEMFNEETGEWIDWSPYQHSITAYLVLFNATKALLNYEQVMKAFQWDGTDMGALQSNDFGDLQIQFEVEPNEYQGRTSLRVCWVDAYDADPTARGGTLTPMDTGKLRTMNAKYKQFMTKGPKGPGPATAPKSTPPVPSTPTLPPTVIPGPDPGSDGTDPMTQIAAWGALNEMGGTTKAISDAWLQGIKIVGDGNGTGEADFNDVAWGDVFTRAAELLSV